MKRFLCIVLGAAFGVQGLVEFLFNKNKTLSALPFALAFSCLVIASSIPKKGRPKKVEVEKDTDDLGIFSHPDFFEICAIAVIGFLIFAFAIFIGYLIYLVYPLTNWQYYLKWVGVAITVVVSCGVIYHLTELWNYLMDADDGISFRKKVKDKMLFPVLLFRALITPDKD